MENIINWAVELNKSNHVGFAILTVVTMAGIGALIGAGIEVFFKALGIKYNKIEIHH
ncbi:MAG: hypothetical protein HQL05_00915 [Nitrospirae bacterium]|uniref:hypothetical protein n=1 Tax=Candidatus Magnetobacterium casense TaxID=1455061 RepID=UPI0012DCF05B|nr:hypothetical protein [Candidatus Magnetobacterium casensis]MBF0336368.1 hypothetical protein [Nitrospirota bacterium]